VVERDGRAQGPGRHEPRAASFVSIKPRFGMIAVAVTDSSLPAYDNPPVVEIVAAAQFAPLPVFGLAEIVTLGRTFEGWRVVDAPPAIPPMVELTPGQPSPTAMGFSFGQPPLRLVLTAGEGAWTAQLQQDRVAVHEHKITARPSFARVEPRLREVARLASEALGREVLGAEHPAEYVELVYDNRIPAADGGWSTFRDLHRVLQVVAPTPADPPYDQVEQLTVAFSEVLQESGEFAGRLRVIAEPLFDEAGEPLLHLRIVSRRLVGGRTVEDVLAACHVDIVEGFTAVTTNTMHEVWERQR